MPSLQPPLPPPPPGPPVPSPLGFSVGVNLSGDEFGVTPVVSEFDYYTGKNINTVRLPFKWESIQPTLGGPLNTAYVANISTLINYAASKGVRVILDCHNFARYNGNTIGSSQVSIPQFANLWTRVATIFSNAANVIGFDIMNEPNNMPSQSVWPAAAQAAINAIGAVNQTVPIYVCGDGFASAFQWVTNNPTLQNLTSLGNLIVYEAHVYPDRDNSGSHFDWPTEVAAGDQLTTPTSTLDTNILVKRLTVFVNWLTLHGKVGQIGEMGIPNGNVNWLTTGVNALNYLQSNGVPVTIWAGGPAWGPYAQSVEPSPWITGYPGVVPISDAEQMAVLTQFSGAAQPTVYFLTGPPSGSVSVASSNFTAQYRGVLPLADTITPSDNGAGGSFTPSSVTLAASTYNPNATFTYTPPAGAMTTRIDVTNNRGLTNPPGVIFTTEVDLFVGIAVPQNLVSDVQLYAAYIGPCRQMRRASDGAVLDFGFAGQALGVANLGRVLDTAAIAAWAPGGTTTIKRYSQEPFGNHMQPVINTDAPASTTADYPAFSIDADGFPTDTFASSRMDMPSALHGATGQTIIANYNYTSGSEILNWDFISSIQFGPSAYQFSTAAQDHPANEQGAMSLMTVAGEYHIYSATWQANTVDGWRTWKDGTQVGKNQTYASVLTSDFNRNTAHFGYSVFSGITGAFKSRDWIVWNSAIPDANNVAIQNFLATHYSTVQPTTVAWDIVMDFVNGVYTVNGSASSLAALTTGARTLDVNGLVGDRSTGIGGVALTALAGANATIEFEIGQGANPLTVGTGLLLFQNGGLSLNLAMFLGYVFGASATGGATGGSQSYNIATHDISQANRFALTWNPTTWETAVNGDKFVTSVAALQTGWTSALLGDPASVTRIHHIKIKSAPSSTIQLLNETDLVGSAGATLPVWLPGVNEAGADFDGGVFWPLDQSIDYYNARGMKIIRLPFRWSRLQPALNGALDAPSLTNIDRIVARATGYGMTVLLDCHSFGAHETFGSIGGGTVTSANLANFWGQMATRYATNPLVAFDLMNEPAGPLTLAQWYSVCQDSITAIRSATAAGLILVPSYGGSSSASRFTNGGNSDAFLAQGFTDTNYALTVHQYFDFDQSGTHDDAARYVGRSDLRAVVRWCRTNSVRFFLGEVGVAKAPSTPAGVLELGELISFMKASNDVCLGYSYWAGGAAWGNGYSFNIEPLNPASSGASGWNTTPYGERPQMGAMRMYL